MLAVLLAALALPPSTPPPPPGAVVRLQNWSGRAEAVVTVRDVSPGPTTFVDAAGATHHAVTISYVYADAPARGAFQTTLGWFLKHVQPPAAASGAPFHDAVSFAGAAAVNPFVGPPPPPRSNQQIGDGVQRPADVLYHVPEFAIPRR